MGNTPILLYSDHKVHKSFEYRPLVDANNQGFWNKLERNNVFSVLNVNDFLEEDHKNAALARPTLEAAAQRSLAYESGSTGVANNGYEIEARKSQLQAHASAVRALAARENVQHAIVPSGIVGLSFGVLAGFRGVGVNVTTVESWGVRPDFMTWNVDAPALDIDYAGWFRELGELDAAQQAIVSSYLAFQEDPTTNAGKEWETHRRYQTESSTADFSQSVKEFFDRYQSTIMLGTNVVGDSATLGRDTIFDSQLEWLRQTIDWFRTQPNSGLVIRVHPGESIGPCPMPLSPWIREQLKDIRNILLITPDNPINTFALSRKANAGLLYVSNLGCDLVARGIPAISAGHSPYHGLGIAREPTDSSEYFDLLQRACVGGLSVSKQMFQAAYQQIYVLTRLISLPGRPFCPRSRSYVPIANISDDHFAQYYKLVSGGLNRADHVKWDRQQLGAEIWPDEASQ